MCESVWPVFSIIALLSRIFVIRREDAEAREPDTRLPPRHRLEVSTAQPVITAKRAGRHGMVQGPYPILFVDDYACPNHRTVVRARHPRCCWPIQTRDRICLRYGLSGKVAIRYEGVPLPPLRSWLLHSSSRKDGLFTRRPQPLTVRRHAREKGKRWRGGIAESETRQESRRETVPGLQGWRETPYQKERERVRLRYGTYSTKEKRIAHLTTSWRARRVTIDLAAPSPRSTAR
jgi:hypothetical protein